MVWLVSGSTVCHTFLSRNGPSRYYVVLIFRAKTRVYFSAVLRFASFYSRLIHSSQTSLHEKYNGLTISRILRIVSILSQRFANAADRFDVWKDEELIVRH